MIANGLVLLGNSMFENNTFRYFRISGFLNIYIIIVMINLHMLVCFEQSFLISANLFFISLQLFVVKF